MNHSALPVLKGRGRGGRAGDRGGCSAAWRPGREAQAAVAGSLRVTDLPHLPGQTYPGGLYLQNTAFASHSFERCKNTENSSFGSLATVALWFPLSSPKRGRVPELAAKRMARVSARARSRCLLESPGTGLSLKCH